MAYQAPYIDEAGIHISSYNDIRDSLIEAMKSIYGNDIYLENDSQDYQMISAFALKAYDVQQALILCYNNSSPSTAIGAGLDRVVAVNGISRNNHTYSTCTVKLTGTPQATINKGKVKDKSNYIWSLPEQVKIGANGITYATATCMTPGRIAASTGDISIIETPTKGWDSVVNEAAARPGVNKETDTELRVKQQKSVANPSQTVFEGTVGAVANVPGVIRHGQYENDTDLAEDILPPHSITFVVEGGEDLDIAQAIFKHKGPGCSTNGNVEVTILDKYGSSNTIRFYRPENSQIEVQISLSRLSGFTDEVKKQIIANIHEYVNALKIGEDLVVSNLNIPILRAQSLTTSPSFYVNSITANKKGESASNMITVGRVGVIGVALADISVTVI